MSEPTDRVLIEAAIAAQEQLRDTLGDAVVDAAIGALRAQMDAVSRDRPIEHERRLVTVLFMDIVDSTRTLRGIDPEETMSIMDAALETLAAPVRAYGGRVTRFMGDGFLAVFGLRRTRENDAEMAVRAGLGILDSARTVAEEVARSYDIADFAVRVGINTGLVVTGGVTEAADTIMGSAVNLASRIETAAPPGGLLVSQSTYRQVRGRFDLEPAGNIDAKGFAESIPVHRVKGERSEAPAGVTRGIDEIRVEMVGRRNELHTLFESLEKVTDSGRGRIVTIVGEAGVGKSRLLAEFGSGLSADPSVITFRARASLERTDVPYSLLRDLVERSFDIRSDAPVSVVWSKLAAGLGAHLADDSSRGAKIGVVGHLLGYGRPQDESPQGFRHTPQQLRDLAVVHLIEFFRNVASSDPVVLLLDDLQWADESSLAVLQDVLDELESHPILTIALSRPLPPTRQGRWEGLPNHLVIPIEPLSTEESESLIDSMLSNIDECPPELRSRLLEHAGGNPYYLEELVMMCIDDGVIVVDDAAWSVHMDRLAVLRVPTTLTGVIRARLEGLPTPEHTVLQQASVVGRVFWDDAIAHIARLSRATALNGPLRSLQARQMIHPRAASTFSQASEYAFSHALLRDATYEEVLLGTRREYHGIVADWLIASSGDREEEFVGLIAGHLEKAERNAEALDYLTRAGDAAWHSYALANAADFYDRALALTSEHDAERRYRLLLSREKSSALMGDRDSQRRQLDDLEEIADLIGDPVKQALVAVERAFLFFYTSDYPSALVSAQRAVGHAAVVDDPTLHSRVQTTLAWALLYLGDWKVARSHGEQALKLAQQSDVAHSEATAQNLLGMIAVTAGELSEARRRLSRALEIAQGEGDRDGATVFLNNLAVALTLIGHYDAARGYIEEILDQAVSSGDHNSESAAHVNLAWIAAAGGAWATAREHAERGIAMKRRQEHVEGEAEGLLWLGHSLVGLGQLDEAEAAYDASTVICRRLEQTALGLEVEAGLVRVALARSDLDDAMLHTEVILHHLDSGESLEGTWEPLRIYLAVVEALGAAGDGRVQRVLDQARTLLHQNADRIVDSEDRHSYLKEVPWHRRIDELESATS